MTKNTPQNHLNDKTSLKLLNWPKILETFKKTKSFWLFYVIQCFQGYFDPFFKKNYFFIFFFTFQDIFFAILEVKEYFGHFKYLRIFFYFRDFKGILVILEVLVYFGHFRGFKVFFAISQVFGYFGKFRDFVGIFGYFEVLGVFCSF